MVHLRFKLSCVLFCITLLIIQSCSEDEELLVNEELTDIQSSEDITKKPSTNKSARESCFGSGWCLLDGAANDVGSNGNGALWIIGTTREGGGYGIYTRNFSTDSWTRVYGGAIAIDVDPFGVPWIVNNAGNIYRFTTSNTWERMPGAAKDIGIGDNGDVWIIGTTERSGGYNIYKWDVASNRWVSSNGSGVRISVDSRGVPWIVNDSGKIFRRNSPDVFIGNGWTQIPGGAYDIGCGAGRVAITGRTNGGSGSSQVPIGPRVYYFDGSNSWTSARNDAGGFTIDVLSFNEVAVVEPTPFRRIWTGR